jgi:RNA polymerase primary sigma factor
MKNSHDRIFQFKPAKLVSSPAQLGIPAFSRRRGASATQDMDAPVITDAEPASVTPGAPSSESFAGNAYHLYLREIGQVKLLTPDEEIALVKRIKRGDKEAREHMIKANLRLVVKIAREYEGLGLPLLDLINEGNIGLMKGVDRFDPRKGAKFSTYGSLWIKQAIRRALTNLSKTIRLPVHAMDKLTRIRKSEVKLHETLNREPTDEEIAADVELDVQRVRRYRDAARAPISLDSPIGDDGSDSVSEIVADANAVAPSDQLANNTDNEMLREVLGTLNEREGKILAMRYGLDDDRPRTLEELGEHFGVTRERIRQIQQQALRKMRQLIEKRDPLSEPVFQQN